MSDTVELRSLVRKCQKGSRSAQKKFYMRYHAFGLRICLRYASSRDRAVHLLNESLYVFFTDTSKSDKDYSIEAQLRKIILNSIINDYHQSKKQADAELHIPVAEQKNMEFNPIAQNDTLSLMQELPDLDRIIFNLFVIDGYSHEEIAKLLRTDVSESVLRLTATRLSLNRSISTTDVLR